MSAHPILDFWFGPIAADGSVAPEVRKRWWTKSPEFDELCRSLFEGEVQAARAGEREELKEDARGCLAFILLCDQIPFQHPLSFFQSPTSAVSLLHPSSPASRREIFPRVRSVL